MRSCKSSKESRKVSDVKTIRLTFVSCLLFVLFPGLQGQPVTKYEGTNATLQGRWKWALQQGSQPGRAEDFWIGYSFSRLMGEDSYILSGNVWSGTLEPKRSLYALITGDTTREERRAMERRSHGEPGIFKHMKDIALLFLVRRNPSGGGEIQKVRECTMDLAFNLNGRPLFWLGAATDDESVRELKEIFGEATMPGLKKDLITAIGLHQSSTAAFPFLRDVLTGKESDDVRASAAFWIGEQVQPESMKVLLNAAERDKSLKVREQAVFAISRFNSDESTDALISLARTADNPKVRGKAAFWLGQKASRKAVATLENIIADDEETEVQRQALFALSQMKDTEGVDQLIKIARTHPNPRIRKQAVQLLGQSDDPRALDALIAIIRQ